MTSLQDLKVVFMGTPEFAVPSLETLLAQRVPVLAVVTGVDKPAGRGLQLAESPIKQIATKRGLPVLQPAKLNEPHFLAELQKLNADLFVVVAFRILPREVFTIPPRGTINLHAGLLPKYRGAAPLQWAIINGETETGATTFLIDEKVDTGQILLQRKTAIGENETAGELHDRLAVFGAGLLSDTLKAMTAGSLIPRPQEGEPGLAPKITKEMAEVDWSKTAVALKNFVRGLNPVPGAYTQWRGQLLKIFSAQPVVAQAGDHQPGQIRRLDVRAGTFWVETGAGVLAIHELQLQGKRRMTAAEFLRGHHMSEGEQLGAGSG